MKQKHILTPEECKTYREYLSNLEKEVFVRYGEERMERKFLIVLLTLTLAIVSAFTLTACGETEKPGGDTDNNGDDNTEQHTHSFTKEVVSDK